MLAYAAGWIGTESDHSIDVVIDTSGDWRLTLPGVEMEAVTGTGRRVVTLPLRSGWNPILITLASSEGESAFRAAIRDPKGVTEWRAGPPRDR